MIPTLSDRPTRVQKAPPIFRFKSADEQTTVSLALDFYALSTSAYVHWEDFWTELQHIHVAAQEVYAPGYATRVGLRYVNQFTFNNTNLRNVEALPEFLRPELVVLLTEKAWTTPLELLSQLVLEGQSEMERLALRVGFKQREPEPFVLLDLDYFIEGNISFERLEDFYQCAHDVIYRAFRWAIREDKLALFGPLPVGES